MSREVEQLREVFHAEDDLFVAALEDLANMEPPKEALERWRRDAELVAAELRAWAKRDSDGWSVARRRQASDRRVFVLPKNRGKE
jgi:hypothetical protein